MTAAGPLAAALLVVEALESLGVEYAIGGSVASSVHGEPRATEDADVVADLRTEQVDGFVARLAGRFYLDPQAVREAVRLRSSFNVVHRETIQKVDVFVLRDVPLDREEIRRRQRSVLTESPRTLAYLTSAEDVILQKLEWYKAGGEVSDRQWRDVLGVIKVQGERLDRPYLYRMAETIDATSLLRRALEETERGSEP